MNYNEQPGFIKNSTIRSEYADARANDVMLGSDDPKSPHRAIPQAFANLEKDLHALGEITNVLNNRLKPISRPDSPATPQEEKVSERMNVPLVNAIAQADRMVRAVLRQLNDIVERIEL